MVFCYGYPNRLRQWRQCLWFEEWGKNYYSEIVFVLDVSPVSSLSLLIMQKSFWRSSRCPTVIALKYRLHYWAVMKPTIRRQLLMKTWFVSLRSQIQIASYVTKATKESPGSVMRQTEWQKSIGWSLYCGFRGKTSLPSLLVLNFSGLWSVGTIAICLVAGPGIIRIEQYSCSLGGLVRVR